jgi:hypothetical protein
VISDVQIRQMGDQHSSGEAGRGGAPGGPIPPLVRPVIRSSW